MDNYIEEIIPEKTAHIFLSFLPNKANYVRVESLKSTDAFVSDLMKDVATRKIKAYERKNKKFEAKYGRFEQFSQKICGKATPWHEDQWMEW